MCSLILPGDCTFHIKLLLSTSDLSISTNPQSSLHFGVFKSQKKKRDTFYVLKFVLFQYRGWGVEIDSGRVPEGLQAMLEDLGTLKSERNNN